MSRRVWQGLVGSVTGIQSWQDDNCSVCAPVVGRLLIRAKITWVPFLQHAQFFAGGEVGSTAGCGVAGCGVAGCGVVGCGVAGCCVAGCGVAGCCVAGCGVADCRVADCGVAGCGVADCGVAWLSFSACHNDAENNMLTESYHSGRV